MQWRQMGLTLRWTSLGISEVLAGSTRTRMQPSYAIKTVHRRERAEDNRQEQLCVPLVPASTYWYLEAVPELLELISRRLEELPEVIS
jgi:hypothetical protein